jgi:hypothetical protein
LGWEAGVPDKPVGGLLGWEAGVPDKPVGGLLGWEAGAPGTRRSCAGWGRNSEALPNV